MTSCEDSALSHQETSLPSVYAYYIKGPESLMQCICAVRLAFIYAVVWVLWVLSLSGLTTQFSMRAYWSSQEEVVKDIRGCDKGGSPSGWSPLKRGCTAPQVSSAKVEKLN